VKQLTQKNKNVWTDWKGSNYTRSKFRQRWKRR